MKEKFYIFSHGGKQYRAEEGKSVWIDYMIDAKPQDKVNVKIIYDSSEGLVKGKNLELTVEKNINGAKLLIQKHRRRKHSEKRTGFRQRYTSCIFGEKIKLAKKELVNGI